MGGVGAGTTRGTAGTRTRPGNLPPPCQAPTLFPILSDKSSLLSVKLSALLSLEPIEDHLPLPHHPSQTPILCLPLPCPPTLSLLPTPYLLPANHLPMTLSTK